MFLDIVRIVFGFCAGADKAIGVFIYDKRYKRSYLFKNMSVEKLPLINQDFQYEKLTPEQAEYINKYNWMNPLKTSNGAYSIKLESNRVLDLDNFKQVAVVNLVIILNPEISAEYLCSKGYLEEVQEARATIKELIQGLDNLGIQHKHKDIQI